MGAFALLCFILAAAPAAAQGTPEQTVQNVFRIIDRLQAEQENQDARRIAWLDGQCQSLAPEVLRWGWRSAAPLAEILKDRSRPVKVRLLAASFLGLTQDPAAFIALRAVLADPGEPGPLRSSAAQSLPGLGVSKAALRRAFCPLLAENGLPRDVLRSSLLALEPIGCDDPSYLENLLMGFGTRPAPAQNDDALRAVSALGRSLPSSAEQSLVRLVDFYPQKSPLHEAALEALSIRREGFRK